MYAIFAKIALSLKSKRSFIISRYSGSKFDQSRTYVSAFASLLYPRLYHFICMRVFRSMWRLELAFRRIPVSIVSIYISVVKEHVDVCMHACMKIYTLCAITNAIKRETYVCVYVCVFPWTNQRHQGSIDLSQNWLANDGHKLNSAESLIDDVNKIGSSVSHIGRLHIRSLSFGNKIHQFMMHQMLINKINEINLKDVCA